MGDYSRNFEDTLYLLYHTVKNPPYRIETCLCIFVAFRFSIFTFVTRPKRGNNKKNLPNNLIRSIWGDFSTVVAAAGLIERESHRGISETNFILAAAQLGRAVWAFDREFDPKFLF